jgi:hypothetical protein
MTYNTLIEKIKDLSVEEKIEIRTLIDKFLIEEKREEIYGSYQQTLNEIRDKKTNYSSDINTLKSDLEND